MAKANMWMPLYIGDYLRDTLGLSRGEHGSYMLLIMAYWSNGGPLLADNDSLRDIAKCPHEEWTRTKGLMLRFFKEQNGHWTHKRIDEELQKSRDMYAKKMHQTSAALRARGIVTSNVTLNATSDVTSGTPTTTPTITNEHPEPSGAELPTLEWCNEWLKDAKTNGADYTSAEVRTAFLALSANGWMWGKNPVVDFRAALERQIQTDRQRAGKPTSVNGSHPHWPPKKEVELYAKEKGDDHGYWVSWYEFWKNKDFKRGDRPIDWKVELSKSMAAKR